MRRLEHDETEPRIVDLEIFECEHGFARLVDVVGHRHDVAVEQDGLRLRHRDDVEAPELLLGELAQGHHADCRTPGAEQNPLTGAFVACLNQLVS